MNEVQRTFVAGAKAYAPTLCNKQLDLAPKPTGKALVGVVLVAFMCGLVGVLVGVIQQVRVEKRKEPGTMYDPFHACHQRSGPDLKPSSPNVDSFDIEALRPGTWRIAAAGGNCSGNAMDGQP